MTEAIYKVGDILEFTEVVPRQFGLWVGPVRGLVVKISDPGYEYLSYRLLLSGTVGTTKNMTLSWAFEKDIVSAAKRVGHVDISALMFMENDEPDYAMLFTAATIAQAADLKNENEKLKAELAKETLKRIRAEAEYEEKAKENERLSNAQRYLDLSNENRELKALNDELRKSIPEYNRLALEHFACTEKIKKLEGENEPLKKENEELRAANEKLAEVNARYLQSMTCAEKQMTEAAKRIYEAREHMNVCYTVSNA